MSGENYTKDRTNKLKNVIKSQFDKASKLAPGQVIDGWEIKSVSKVVPFLEVIDQTFVLSRE